jgi:AcrR family transcriptional regulator
VGIFAAGMSDQRETETEEEAARPRRGRPPGLSDASREALLNAAEDLFGSKGIAGVSLREIAEAAGQRNNSVVRYHFRSKERLLEALLSERIGAVERARQALVDRHAPLAEQPAEALLRILWEPLLEIGKRQNQHRFVHCLLACQIEQRGARHPLATAPEGHPASGGILAALCRRFPHVGADHCMYRLGLLATMFWAAVAAHDRAVCAGDLVWSSRFSLDETIKLTVAALAAPA